MPDREREIESLTRFVADTIDCRIDAAMIRAEARALLSEGNWTQDQAEDLLSRADRIADGDCSGQVHDPSEARAWALGGFALIAAGAGAWIWSKR